MRISVVVPSHNPNTGRLRRVLAALCDQSLPGNQWEVIVVDNASSPPIDLSGLIDLNRGSASFRIVREPRLGLSHARLAGLNHVRAPLVTLVDDDNVLASDYLERCCDIFDAHPKLGLAGGKSAPEFERIPDPWTAEFHDLLAIRDLGPNEIITSVLRPAGSERNCYPLCAPIGAGMTLRLAACENWRLRQSSGHSPGPPDRTGSLLTSGGDNDLVLTALQSGWSVGYFPRLVLTHLIPSERLTLDYLSRANRDIQRSWVQTLALHDANPWRPIPPWTLPLRLIRAYLRSRPWHSCAHRIRWQGLRGRLEGQADIYHRTPIR